MLGEVEGSASQLQHPVGLSSVPGERLSWEVV